MTNDINLLMSRMDEINAKTADQLTADDIDTIIIYYRKQRARKESGEKIGVKADVDLTELVNSLKPQTKINIGKRI